MAPSDDGQVSPKRIGSHSIGELITSSNVTGSLQVRVLVAGAVGTRIHRGDCGPMWPGGHLVLVM